MQTNNLSSNPGHMWRMKLNKVEVGFLAINIIINKVSNIKTQV